MSQRITAEMAKPANMSASLLKKRLMSGKIKVNEDGELEKFCARCNDYWPADSEFFFSCASTNDGLTHWCKACYIEWRYPNGRGCRGRPRKSHEGFSA